MATSIKIDGSRLIHKNFVLVGTKPNPLQPDIIHDASGTSIANPWKTTFLPIGTNLTNGSDWYVNGGAGSPPPLPTVFSLPDDTYTIVVQSANFSVITFTVTGGIVNYDHNIDNIVNGRGTNSLVLIGVKITIDARYLIGNGVMLGGVWNDFRVLITGYFLPNVASHKYSFIVGSGIVAAFEFNITIGGKVVFDTVRYNHYAQGNNTDTLTLLGYPVLIDGRSTGLFRDANPIFTMIDNHNPSSATNVILGNYLPLRNNINDGFYLLQIDSAGHQKGFHINDIGIITVHLPLSQDMFNGIRRVTVK
jgi:hypothetical protein